MRKIVCSAYSSAVVWRVKRNMRKLCIIINQYRYFMSNSVGRMTQCSVFSVFFSIFISVCSANLLWLPNWIYTHDVNLEIAVCYLVLLQKLTGFSFFDLWISFSATVILSPKYLISISYFLPCKTINYLYLYLFLKRQLLFWNESWYLLYKYISRIVYLKWHILMWKNN